MYKYSCVSENKSVLNWTFLSVTHEKPNCMKLVAVVGLLSCTCKKYNLKQLALT